MGKGDKKSKKGKIFRKSYGKKRPKKKCKKVNPIVLALRKIRNLNLSKYPEKQLKNAITELGKVGIVIMILHKGKSIIRLRPNKNDKEVFSQKCELSYKPQKFNTTYQRASTPNKTMFYGCVVPEKTGQGEIENARITAVLEASNMYRNNIEKGTEKLTFSRWVVNKDVPLIAIVHHKDFVNKTGHSTELNDAYNAFILKHPEHRENSKLITAYFAKEFSKKEISKDSDYMISALFTERVVENGLAGVYYPSVRADAKGFNVAISPEYVDEYLDLVYTGECTLYKNGTQIFVDNDTEAILSQGQAKFTFQEIKNPNIRIGRKESMKRVNLAD